MRGFLLRALFALIALIGAGVAEAQPSCQWLSEGSASTLLGGTAVTTNAKFLPSGEGSCTFSLQQEHSSYVLEIIVSAAATNTCPAGSESLKGIGNEATVCRLQAANASKTAIYSRVRKSTFEVSLTTGNSDTSQASLLKQKEIVEKAAEQVAGNLF